MKKKLVVISILIVAMTIVTIFKFNSEQTIRDDEGLIAKVREELALPDDSTANITIAGRSSEGGKHIFWFIVSDSGQENTYIPMRFTEVSSEEYNFECKLRPIERGQDIFFQNMANGRSFFINNPSCSYIRITDSTGTKYIPIDNIPFVYYYERMGTSFSYDFLDADKNVIK